MSSEPTPAAPPPNLVSRFGRWVAWAVALAALLYVGVSVWVGVDQVSAALQRFNWSWYLAVLGLTLVNYVLRFTKWHVLLGRLGVKVPVLDNFTYFIAGLAMVISPAKAGELVKPYLVRTRTGAPMATTIPALITERLTDGMAALAIAAISVGRFASDRAIYVWGPIITTVVGLAILSHKGLSLAILRVLSRLPGVGRVGHKLEEMYLAMRTCLAPGTMFWMMALSLVAWGAECVGYMLVFRGFGQDVPLETASFLYAFATVVGGPSPGGLGVADGVLVELPMHLIPSLDRGLAVASAGLIRIATLWFGVVIGAIALIRVGGLLAAAPPPESGER